MATKIKLTHSQYKDWRNNHAQLLDEQGEFFRFATNEEQHEAYVFAETQKATRNQSRNPERGPLLPYEIEIEGRKYQVVRSQDVICSHLLKEFGEVILVDPSNRRLKNIRDPEKIPMSYEQSMGVMPPGDSCECSGWPGRPPGRHHPVCAWSKKEREQVMGTVQHPSAIASEASRPSAGPKKPDMNFVVRGSTHHVAPTDGPSAAISGAVVDPANCICKDWGTIAEKQSRQQTRTHHVICQNAEAWNAHQKSIVDSRLSKENIDPRPSTIESEPVEAVDVYYIYDMTSMLKLREADLAEIEESKASLQATHAPTIMIDNIMYIVSTESGESRVMSKNSELTQNPPLKTVADTLKPDADDTTVSSENVLDNFLSQLSDTQRAELVKKLLASSDEHLAQEKEAAT